MTWGGVTGPPRNVWVHSWPWRVVALGLSASLFAALALLGSGHDRNGLVLNAVVVLLLVAVAIAMPVGVFRWRVEFAADRLVETRVLGQRVVQYADIACVRLEAVPPTGMGCPVLTLYSGRRVVVGISNWPRGKRGPATDLVKAIQQVLRSDGA
jgi:hypothetical protein